MGARPKAGEVLEVEIDKAVYRGVGLARHDGQVVLVARGLPGDRVRARVRTVGKDFLRADALETIRPSPLARPTPCSLFPRCGGCSYQHARYEEQLRMKEAILRESLHRAGVEWSAGVPVVPSPEIGWRARATFHVECRDGGVAVGFFQEGSHRVVDLTTPCLQVSSGMSHLILHLRERLAARRDLAPLVQRLHLAESLGGSSLVLTFEGSLGAAETHALAVLSGDSPLVTGVGAVVVGPTRDRYVSISGDPHLVHEVRDVRLRAHARSFFQANRYLVGDLVATVESLLPPGGTLIDLFGGVGLLGLAAGRTADRVVVVEQDPTSAADAAANAEAWGARVRVDACSSAEALARLRPEAGERIVVDPPRAGLEPGLIRALAERAPAVIVYVSCDPTTLARDLRRFAERGLVPDAIRALDLFPDTLHLEVVARLRTA